MLLKELAAEYDASARALDKRIQELREMERASQDPDESWHLRQRVNALIPLRKEARTLAALALLLRRRLLEKCSLHL